MNAEDLKILQAMKNGGNVNVDDELAELEKEIGAEGGNDDKDDLNNPKKNTSDDELDALEKELGDNIDINDDEEEEKKQQAPKPAPKPQPVPQKPPVQKIEPKKPPEPKKAPEPKKNPEPKKEEPKKVTKTEPKINNDDLFPENVEGKYHDVNKMNCMTCLEKEVEICDKIIAIKKKANEDSETWEFKKDSIETRNKLITSMVEKGAWDFNMYKKKIQEQYQWEKKLLLFVEKDTHLNDKQKTVIKKRVNDRLKLIEQELTTNFEGEEGGEKEQTEGQSKPKDEPKKEEIKKEEKKEEKKEVNKGIDDLKKAPSLSPILSVPKGKEEEEKERIHNIVKGRLSEYRNAMDYFQINELTEQQKKAIQCAKLINIELNKIENGKWKEVNEFNLPDPVTPEFIYGYSNAERQDKFKKIITEYFNLRKNTQNDMNKKLEELKQMKPAQRKRVELQYKKDLDALKSKKETYDKFLNKLKEQFQDKWVPAPLYYDTIQETQVPKINKDIPENTLRIIFGNTNYKKDDRVYLIVKYPEKKKEETFDQKAPGDWTHTIEWKFDKGDFKTLHREKFLVEIYERRRIFSDKYKGKFILEPKGLKDHIEYIQTCNIELESKREGQTAEIKFQVRNPCKEVEYTTETKTIFKVTKIYQPFNIKGGKQQEASNFKTENEGITSQDLKVVNSGNKPTGAPAKVTKPAPKPQQQVVKPKPPAKKKEGGKPQEVIDPSEFTAEELKDPDDINSLNTMQVLEFKLKKYEAERDKIDGRCPRDLMQRIIKIKVKKQNLENSFGSEIGPQDYLALLVNTFNHDKKLATYFTQKKDAKNLQLVNERIPLIFKEIEELNKQIKK